MKLKFKHQKFQEDAAMAVVNCFLGQSNSESKYLVDSGNSNGILSYNITGFSNQQIIPELTDDIILENINKMQRENGIKPSENLEGKYNLTIEMETGVGKTYTYIKTMYELNKKYGWSKFIIVVPSIAIREGVYKSLEITSDHFAEQYNKKIRYFVYNSQKLQDIEYFASDSGINVMIINSQAFNAKGKDARRITMKLDEFRSRRPIDIIAKTNPILIIDEPQSVEGKQTKENLKRFNPLFTLRYSATHKDDSKYNMVYRLDALEAYNKKLVKKIQVKGISQIGNNSSAGYIYLESINLSKNNPTATIQIDYKLKNAVVKKSLIVREKDNLYSKSNELEEYKDKYVVKTINGINDSIEFLNGIKIYTGDIIGDINEHEFRRIQIRETILSHIEKERNLFNKGIKVLSLFFIDEVAKYRQYNDKGMGYNGLYADIFEEEYEKILNDLQMKSGEDDYTNYLNQIKTPKTHQGYFSIDKKGKMIDSKINKKENASDDVDAYDLIMKNKELLLDLDPMKSPVRFIFSHSALKEGWDNPNVFQICTLKQSESDVRKRQEIGRGLRLCVDNKGDRMDSTLLDISQVHNINVLTVVASESYDSFTKALQIEIAETIYDRPIAVDMDLFIGVKIYKNEEINQKMARSIYNQMVKKDYVDDDRILTDKYYEDRKNGEFYLSDELTEILPQVIETLNKVYNPNSLKPENAKSNNVELILEDNKFNSKEFKELWNRINKKSYYTVNFETDELVQKCINKLDKDLHVSKIYFVVTKGSIEEIKSKNELSEGNSLVNESSSSFKSEIEVKSSTKYDLIGKIVDYTNLTRKTVVSILKGIKFSTFNQFKNNPEEFIIKVSNIINDEKATTIIEHISYNLFDSEYDTSIFTDITLKGKLDKNVCKVKKHIYDYLIYDSTKEKNFADELDIKEEVAVYVKLPAGFYISTPLGKYNPDWAIAFYEGKVKHVYFVAETKGSMKSMQLREVEKSKIKCARKHFSKLNSENIKYGVVDSYKALYDIVNK
ncbi:type III restriction-modification system endonuclease [Oceanivirga salmonicida]|uniref:type III restriction-modification system endonuclease n=1 Tax=Oceanivirga salmonicida TaxID=1769291 RepID=UPI0012E20D23|nr:DEAD/DEAH box helicase family protein [Oceanivirga salmonicida]